MLINIKSKYIVKQIFSFILPKQQLKIIKYNQKLKILLELNDINKIKTESKKVLEIDDNGFGKIYSLDGSDLYFEGQLLNGKKNGFGKEYQKTIGCLTPGKGKHIIKKTEYKGQYISSSNYIFMEYLFLLYEGEFKNGKKDGKGKEYNLDGLIYEGGFKEGKRNGKGKAYDKDGNNILLFEGDFKNDDIDKNGKGREFDLKGNLIFEGKYRNNKKWDGKIIEYNDKGKIQFEGEIKNGEKNGKGREFDDEGNIIYEDEYLNGKKIYTNEKELKKGKKIIEQYDKQGNLILYGEFQNETLWNGIEKVYDNKNNLLFEVEFKNGEKNNKNLKFEGECIDGKRWNGRGKEFNEEEDFLFEGEYKNGIKWKGKIIYYYKMNQREKDSLFNRIIYSECEYNNGELTGFGKIYSKNENLMFEGQIIKGLIHGEGKLFDDEGNIIFKGEFYENKLWNGEMKNRNKRIIQYYVNNPDSMEYKGINFIFDGDNYIILGRGENYLFEGKLIDGKRNGNIKQYDNEGFLIFEIEYLEGKRNGKTKEYFYGKLIFEGEYLNDKKNGYGIQYNIINNKIKYKGEYKEGKKSGKGKEFNDDGELIYEGEFFNDLKDGQGKCFDKSEHKIFKGTFKKGNKYNGKETEYKGKDIRFDDIYVDGKIVGKKIMKELSKGIIKFEGESVNGIKNGKGKEYNLRGKLIFEGEYLDGKRHGNGNEYNSNGEYYKGQFIKGKKWDGTGYNRDNTVDYVIIKGCGTMKEYHEGKLIYEGECQNGLRHGIGKEYDSNTHKLNFKGRFKYGKKLA